LLVISDAGTGMDQRTLARVFEPFFSTKGQKGTGLALSAVHGIIKQSGGHIAIYSEAGQGTTFQVYLPRDKDRPAAGQTDKGQLGMPRGGETVLLVEDEDGVRSLARHIF
jgi:nitrogen-specific signal transduction histidine kinase